CGTCHGVPGQKASASGQGLNPPPPQLETDAVQARSDAQLYWVVNNGLRMMGMPAWWCFRSGYGDLNPKDLHHVTPSYIHIWNTTQESKTPENERSLSFLSPERESSARSLMSNRQWGLAQAFQRPRSLGERHVQHDLIPLLVGRQDVSGKAQQQVLPLGRL